MRKNDLYGILFLLGMLSVFSACEKDNDKNVTGNEATNKWIDNNMRSWYLWYDEIPEKSKLDFNAEPESFFYSLLSLKDGKEVEDKGHHYYSTIKKKANSETRSNQGESPTLGFEFQWWTFTREKISAINVLYVLPNSPASDAGIRRGDWIQAINGSGINSASVQALLGTGTVRLKIGKEPNGATKELTLTPRMVDDNPVYLDTVYTFDSKDLRVGYLVYNHFTSGPGGYEDETYNNSMRKAFVRFKAAGVNLFILDLRYNGGGLVNCAQLLATMLAPVSCLDDRNVFCRLEFNKNHSSSNYSLTFDRNYMNKGVAGANLDLPRLFVLTSFRTASASEAVVNALRPYYNVILVGEKTEGKNVGSITLEDAKYNYELHPIVSRIFNSKNETDYANGFSPAYLIPEEPITNNGQLGDYQGDMMLDRTLYYILNNSWSSKARSLVSGDYVSEFNSLERKKLNSVLLP